MITLVIASRVALALVLALDVAPEDLQLLAPFEDHQSLVAFEDYAVLEPMFDCAVYSIPEPTFDEDYIPKFIPAEVPPRGIRQLDYG